MSSGSGTPTANWGISKFDTGDAIAPIENLWNAQADDMEAALNTAQTGFYLRYATKALLLANTTAVAYQHASVYNDPTTYFNGDYYWNGSAWILSVGGVRFKGSFLTSVTLAATTPFKYSTIIEDTASGWSASTGKYTVPFAGSYLVCASFKQSSATSTALQIYQNSNVAMMSANCAATQYSGASMAGYVQCAAGDTIYVETPAAFNTQSDTPAHNNYLEIVKVA